MGGGRVEVGRDDLRKINKGTYEINKEHKKNNGRGE